MTYNYKKFYKTTINFTKRKQELVNIFVVRAVFIDVTKL